MTFQRLTPKSIETLSYQDYLFLRKRWWYVFELNLTCLEMFSLAFPRAAVWRASSPLSSSEAMIHCNEGCFHSELAFCYDLTSMKIRMGLGVLVWTLTFTCNLKIYCCSTFVLKHMYRKSQEDAWWESHFPVFGLGFRKINKTLLRETFAVCRVQDGCWLIRTSSALKVTHMTSIFFWEKELNY